MFGKSKRKQRSAAEAVILNVYDLTPINGYAYWFGLGVYHSAIQVHGVEYAYGAHDNSTTGIFESSPRHCPGFAFRKAILIGRTDLGPRQVREVMQSMAPNFSGDTYNLITKNCNHFCNEASLRLTGKPIPKWVNRLAKIGFLCNCVLPAHVAPVRQRSGTVEKWKLWSRSMRVPSAAPEVNDEGRDAEASISLPVTTISSRDSVGAGGAKMRRASSLSAVNGVVATGAETAKVGVSSI